MIAIERTIIDGKDEYFEIPLEDAVDDLIVFFTIVNYDSKNTLTQKVIITKDLLESHLKYTSQGLICRVPLKKLI
jgi:hypothetical protein